MAYDGTLRFDTSLDSAGFQKDAGKLGDIVKGLDVFKLIEKGLEMVTSSIDRAVSRYDTLDRFPKIMQQMGFSAEDTGASMQKLSDGIQGLPTSLDQIVGSTQRIASMTGNLTGAADITLALNNAFLASGSSSDAAARGMEQYMQIIGRGKPEMEDWKTLQETMPYALQKVAESFGYAGTSATRDFYAALQSGEITVEQMNARFVELSTAAGGFAETAKTATGGIGTAFTNMQTSIVRGVAGVVESIDDGLSETRFKSIENVISGTGKAIESILKAVGGAVGFVAQNLDTLLPIVVGVAGAFKAYSIIGTVTTMYRGFQTVVNAATATLAASQGAILMDTASHTMLTAALANETKAEAIRAAAKKAGMSIDAAGNLVTASGAAANAAETATVLASSGALTAKTVIVGVLTGGVSIATAAQWAWNAAMTANPIGAVVAVVILAIAAIAALVVGIIALIGWLQGESEEYKKQKKELEELSKAHEEYTKQLEEDQAAAEQTIAKTKAQADANSDLVTSLRGLMSTNDKAGSDNVAIAQTIDQLNNSVDGLGLAYDETTGKLSANIDEVEDYVKAHGQLNVIKAQEDEYNRLLGEQLELQAKIRVEEERQKVLAQQLADKNISQSEYNKLIKSSNELLKEYGATETALAVDVQAAHAAIDTAAKESATAQVNAFNAVNGALDAEGKNLKQLASQYGMTTDQILAEMQEQGLSMEAWSAKKAEMFTKEGQSLQGVAAQWGLTADEVQAQMAEMGMSLDEYAQHMEDTHTKEGLSLDDLAAKWGTTTEAIKTEMDNMGLSMQEWSEQQQAAWEDYEESIKERTEGVVNSFKKIPGEYDKSATEMLEILINNKTRYAEWETAMGEITKQLGPTAAAEFAKLGPEATSAMQEILGSAELLDQYREVFGVKIDEATGLAVENWNDPSFIGAPSTAIATSAQKVNENTALSSAVTTQMEGAKTAAEAVDFSAVGQGIASDIVSGLNGADVTGAMNNITSAIQGNTGKVTSAVTGMSNSVQSVFRTMSTQSQNTVTQMMTGVNSAIVSRSNTVKSSVTSMGNGVITSMNSMKAQAVNVTTQMMSAVSMAIISQKAATNTAATSVASSAVQGLQPMVDGAQGVANNMMAGLILGIQNGSSGVVNAITQVVSDAIAAAKQRADIRSPSRVFKKEIGEQIMAGWGIGVSKNSKLVTSAISRSSDSALEEAKSYLAEYKKIYATSAQEEMAYWTAIAKKYDNYTKERAEADAELLKVSKKYINERQQAEKLSATQVAIYWKDVSKSYGEGTTARIEAEQEYLTAQQDVMQQVSNIEQNYQNLLDNRTKKIAEFTGLFRGVERESKSVFDLTENLRTQVTALEDFKKAIEQLRIRGISSEMLEYLEDLGPAAVDEIEALSHATDEELAEYADLFKQKYKLAKEQATSELREMRKESEEQIKLLKEGIFTEFNDLTMQMIKIGAMLGGGLATGLRTSVSNVSRAAADLASAVLNSTKSANSISTQFVLSPDVVNTLAEQLRGVTEVNPLRGINLVPQAAYAGAGGGTNYSTHLTQNITTPKPLSPSEMTKEGQDLLRRQRWQLP